MGEKTSIELTFILCPHVGHRSQVIPFFGSVCPDCFDRLAQPLILEGAVTGPSVLELVAATRGEFDARIESLRAKALHAVQVERVVTIPLYSIGTWDMDLQSYSPQPDVPAFNLTAYQLRQSMHMLRKWGYSCHRYRDADGSHDDNDWAVLIERTDGKPEAEILEGWKRGPIPSRTA